MSIKVVKGMRPKLLLPLLLVVVSILGISLLLSNLVLAEKSDLSYSTACKVWLYTPQWVQGDMTTTKIAFDYVEFDKNNEWDKENKRWVCKEDGIYAIELHLAMTMSDGMTNLQSRITKNKEQTFLSVGYGHQNDSACAYPKSLVLVELVVGDYIEASCLHDNLDYRKLATGDLHCGMQIWRVN